MTNKISDSINIAVNILKQQEATQSKLKRLSSLIELCKEDKKISKILQRLEDESSDEEAIIDNALDWINEKIAQLKPTKIAKHAFICAKIKFINDLISCERYVIGQHHFITVIDAFKCLANLVASFGNHDWLKNWSTHRTLTEIIEVIPEFFDRKIKNLLDLNASTPVSTCDQIGKLLVKKLASGFITAKLLPKDKNNAINRLVVEKGFIHEFLFPKDVLAALNYVYKGYVIDFHDDVKMNLKNVYQYLSFLCQFSHHAPETANSINEYRPKNWREVQKKNQQVCASFFITAAKFEGGKPDAEQAKLACSVREEIAYIDQLADLFLNFLQEELLKFRKPGNNKQDLKNIINKCIQDNFSGLSKNDILRKSSEFNSCKMYETVESYLRHHNKSVDALTKRLVASCYREFLKSQGIKRKGGRNSRS